MDLKTAKNLKQGQVIYHTYLKNMDGTAQRFKVTSIKTWKRSLKKILIKVKRGLYEYGTVFESNLHLVTIEEPTYE